MLKFKRGEKFKVIKECKDKCGDTVNVGDVWEVVSPPTHKDDTVRFERFQVAGRSHNYMLFDYEVALSVFRLCDDEPKSLEVDEDFIRAAHRAACSEWKVRIESKFPEVFPKQTHKIGNRYRGSEGDEYILVYVEDSKVMLSNLKNGRRWNNPVSVKDTSNITHDEFIEIIGGGHYVKYISTTPIKD